MFLSDRHASAVRDFKHDAEIVVSQVLNGGFSQLWGNFHGRRGYSVPQMIARTADYFEEVGGPGAPELVAVFREAESVSGDDEGMTEEDEGWQEMMNALDALDSKMYAAWDLAKSEGADTWEIFFGPQED